MAALNFVAVEDGLEEDPKIVSLARILHTSRALAVWYVVRLRRMVLRHGNHITGSLPRNFNDEDLASFLEFEGRAHALIVALKKQGYLAKKSGRGFLYPDWEKTITGRYASQRERDRMWHEKHRKERLSDDVGRQSLDASADSRTTSDDIQTGRKEGSLMAPPCSPPKGGLSKGLTRWAWLMENAPTPQNKDLCARYLATMSPEDWELVQFAYTSRQKGGPNISVKNARALAWPTDTFLRKSAFYRFAGALRTWKNEKTKPSKQTSQGEKAKPEPSHEEQAHTAWKWVEQYLADPVWSEHEKDKRKAAFAEQWKCRPWEGDRPWEKKAATKKPTKGDKRS